MINTKLTLHLPNSFDPNTPVEVSVPSLTIGRSKSCELNVRDYFATVPGTVSREHCQIIFRDGEFVLIDLRSVNGTYLNGYRLGVEERVTLRNGDLLQLASDKNLTFEVKITENLDDDATKPIVNDQKLSTLLQDLRSQRDLLLLGVAGTGKSTLMRRLIPHRESEATFNKYLPDHRHVLFCYVDGRAVSEPSLEQFCRLMFLPVRTLLSEGTSELRGFFDELARSSGDPVIIRNALLHLSNFIARECGRRLVVLLDHFDELYPQLPPSLFWILQELKRADTPPLLVIAMQDEFSANNRFAQQFLHSIHPATYTWLPVMSTIQLQQVVSNLRLNASQAAKSIELGGGQPRLTELVGQILERMDDVPKEPSSLIRLLLTHSVIRAHCQAIVDSLREEEQDALATVTAGQARMSYAVEQQLTSKKQILTGEEQSLRFRSALLAEYIRRQSSSTQPGLARPPQTVLEDVVIDGHPVPATHLTKREEDLLRLFLEHPNQVCSYDDISGRVWGYEPDDAATPESIASLVANLRRKLDEISAGSGKRYIQNVRGRGYTYQVE